MSLRIRFLTAVLKKSAIRRHYPKASIGFRLDYPEALEDHYLFGLVFMSSEELQETLQRIGDTGLDLIESCTVGDQFIGPIEPHPHFEYQVTGIGSLSVWHVRLIDDEPEVLAEDGGGLLRHHIRMGWAFSLGQEEDAE